MTKSHFLLKNSTFLDILPSMWPKIINIFFYLKLQYYSQKGRSKLLERNQFKNSKKKIITHTHTREKKAVFTQQ